MKVPKLTRWQRIKGKFYFKFISPGRMRRFRKKVAPLLAKMQYLKGNGVENDKA